MGYNIPLPRVELPTFRGENPCGWLWKGKENIIVDALSRKNNSEIHIKDIGALEKITNVLLDWYENVHASYEKDCKLRAIILGKLTGATGEPDYTYKKGILRYKGRIVAGQEGNLRTQLVKSLDNSYVRGHAGIQNTYRRLETDFY
jgi:hypothetical protein